MDTDEFEAVVRSMERPLGSFLAQMAPSLALAEELLQETMLVAWRDRERMPTDPDARRAWLYGVARHRALQALRKGRRGRAAFEAASAGHSEAAADDVESFAMHDLLVRTLRPKDRSLFVLRYVQGFTAESLAAMTGMRPATVRKRLERAAAALRLAMQTPEITEQEDDHARPAYVG